MTVNQIQQELRALEDRETAIRNELEANEARQRELMAKLAAANGDQK